MMRKRTVIVLLLACAAPLSAQKRSSIYHAGWIDHDKNGRMDPYEDPKLDVEGRITDLLGRMTLEEKAAQLATLYGFANVLPDEQPTPAWKTSPWKGGIANIDEQLSGRDSNEKFRTRYSWPPSAHARALNEIQRWFIEDTRLGIPVDFTMEGIRGLGHEKATSFPAEAGVGSTWDVDLVSAIGHVTGREARALGYTNVYSPVIDLARDPRWGRVEECYSEDPFLTAAYGAAQVRGIQAEGAASTLKHFALNSIPVAGRDGPVRKGAQATWREVLELHLPPFRAAISAGALGVMAAYAEYDGVPMGASRLFLTDILRKELGFEGYVVSDSGVLERMFNQAHFVAASFKEAVRQAIEAGL
ncbi:MAG TPA: glycoside hydrolase family 3 N-terminal domain-containing protein, partial [Longimicrobiales bacterium]